MARNNSVKHAVMNILLYFIITYLLYGQACGAFHIRGRYNNMKQRLIINSVCDMLFVRNVRTKDSRPQTRLFNGSFESSFKDILRKCANERCISANQVIEQLQLIDSEYDSDARSSSRSLISSLSVVSQKDVSGFFELIFSSAVADLPIIGKWLDGYLPNRETIEFDFESRCMKLKVETLPLLPSIDIIGKDLSWESRTASISYTVEGKSEMSTWRILYVDDEYGIVAAKSSVTGWNLIRRVPQFVL